MAVLGQSSTSGVLLKDGTLTSPSPEIREILMGFTSGDTEAARLTPEQRIRLLGQCTDLNLVQWTFALVNSTSQGHQPPQQREHPDIPWENTYTFSQPLPNLREAPALPPGDTPSHHASTRTETPPNPIPWTPRFFPEEWVYTDGSDIKGNPRMGAAVVHIPTRITIYIDADGCEVLRIIMRAEQVAIHTALTRFEDHSWLGIITESLSNLQAIHLHYYRPGLSIAPRYHHHMFLLQSISQLLETRRERVYSTSLRKIRAHTYISGNDLADATAKLAVTEYDTLPLEPTMGFEIGAIAPRPPFCVMYTATPPTPTPALAT
jgi:hypothetical protein